MKGSSQRRTPKPPDLGLSGSFVSARGSWNRSHFSEDFSQRGRKPESFPLPHPTDNRKRPKNPLFRLFFPARRQWFHFSLRAEWMGVARPPLDRIREHRLSCYPLTSSFLMLRDAVLSVFRILFALLTRHTTMANKNSICSDFLVFGARASACC